MITFYKATGITIVDWRGKLWLRWSDAVKEAGYPPNKKAGPYDEELLIDKFIGLMRELGHFPLSTELRRRDIIIEPSQAIWRFERGGGVRDNRQNGSPCTVRVTKGMTISWSCVHQSSKARGSLPTARCKRTRPAMSVW